MVECARVSCAMVLEFIGVRGFGFGARSHLESSTVYLLHESFSTGGRRAGWSRMTAIAANDIRRLITPSPLAGEGWGGGSALAKASLCARSRRLHTTPHPNPPPQGGREPEGSTPCPELETGE